MCNASRPKQPSSPGYGNLTSLNKISREALTNKLAFITVFQGVVSGVCSGNTRHFSSKHSEYLSMELGVLADLGSSSRGFKCNGELESGSPPDEQQSELSPR